MSLLKCATCEVKIPDADLYPEKSALKSTPFFSFCPDSACQSSGSLLSNLSQPEITVTQHHTSSESSSLAPLVEQEGEAYLEKAGGVRRHTVANVQSDVQLLGRRHSGMEDGGGDRGDEGCVKILSPRPFSSQPDMVEPPRGGVIC